MKDQEPPDSLKEGAPDTSAQAEPGDQPPSAKSRITQGYPLVVMTLQGPQSTVRRPLGKPTRRLFTIRISQLDERPQQSSVVESAGVLEEDAHIPLAVSGTPLRSTPNDPDGAHPERLAHLRQTYQVIHPYDSVEWRAARGVAPVVVVPAEFRPSSTPLPQDFFSRLLQEWDEEGMIQMAWFSLDCSHIPPRRRRSIKLWVQTKACLWKDRGRMCLNTVLFFPRLIIRLLSNNN